MSSVETDKMMDILSEITLKIMRENEERKRKKESSRSITNEANEQEINQKQNEISNDKKINNELNNESQEPEKQQEENIDINNTIDGNKEELNNFIDNEVTNEEENVTYLTKSDVEGILNEYFSRIEDVLHDYNEQNIDADTFKDHLNGLVGHVKTNARAKFKAISHASTKPIRELKSYAKSRVNQFMDGINERLKKASASIDNKLKDEKISTKEKENTQEGYKQKIENALKNDPQLLKEVATITRLNAISKHLSSTREKINELDKLEAKSPEDQAKISKMKDKLNSHAKEIQNEVNELTKSHSQEQTLDKINTKVMEIERSDKEVTLER